MFEENCIGIWICFGNGKNDKINFTQKMKFVPERVQDIVGWEKELVTRTFSFARNVSTSLFLMVVEVRNVL